MGPPMAPGLTDPFTFLSFSPAPGLPGPDVTLCDECGFNRVVVVVAGTLGLRKPLRPHLPLEVVAPLHLPCTPSQRRLFGYLTWQYLLLYLLLCVATPLHPCFDALFTIGAGCD